MPLNLNEPASPPPPVPFITPAMLCARADRAAATMRNVRDEIETCLRLADVATWPAAARANRKLYVDALRFTRDLIEEGCEEMDGATTEARS